MLSLGQMGEWQHGLPVLGALVVMICVGRYAVLVEALSTLSGMRCVAK
jgi:hypothetical protein